jgi:hypothetical protein
MVMTGFALAAGTPVWWDNPKGLPNWTRTIATGTASNTGPQAQYIIAKIDVPNTYRENYSKYIWAQVEWSLVEGTGKFMTGFTDHLIKWLNSADQCPASPEEEYPDPDGYGFMKCEGDFAPEFGFLAGYELSYFKITPQPACERLEVRFEVGPNSRIDYRIEIQTVCINWDYGDAPDPEYPTLAKKNGACHIVTGDCFLGSLIDHEENGQPNADATGDDLNGDDEEGVLFATPDHLTQGSPVALTVTASKAGYLNAWADFDANGSWADPGEQIFTGAALQAGANSLNFTIPAAAALGTTFLRFRFGTDQSLSFSGPAGDGEVEDYQIAILPAEYDFGDAPDPTFPTLLANDGARHRKGNLMLGALIDAEEDGLQSAEAVGDDNGGQDDEDGVLFDENTLITGKWASIIVTASSAGFLNAWVDFNDNGSWNEAGEQIFKDRILSAGENPLTFYIPDTAKTLDVCARFRFNSAGKLTPAGAAEDGEVEDYQIPLKVPVELSSFTARVHEGAVILEWITQSETENVGFHIYRAEAAGEYSQITSRLIEGAGTSANAHAYSYEDGAVEAGQTYRYKLADLDRGGHLEFGTPLEITVAAPDQFELGQNYPNPFNPSTIIPFKIKQSGFVSLDIYNLKGQLVRSLVQRSMPAGSHAVVWDGRDGKGAAVPSGSYLYKLKTAGFEQSRRMEYIK